MMIQLIQKPVHLEVFSNQKGEIGKTWVEIQWSVEQYGSIIRLTSTLKGAKIVNNLQTHRQFNLNEHGESIEKQKAYFIEQMEAAEQDLFSRLDFIWKALTGRLDDPLEGVEIKWIQPPTS